MSNAVDWHEPLRELASKGAQAERPRSLAGLAAARREHCGQFFTSDALARYMWQLAEPAARRTYGDGRAPLLDNSIGSGRLLQFADPALHALYGCDVDAAAVSAVADAVQAAGFQCEILHAGMESVRPSHMAVAYLNPPFSLHLESPHLEPYACTTWGRYGAHTSTVSHAYAIAQALEAAGVVIAVVPSAYAEEAAASDDWEGRLAAVIGLPAGTFREEGTEVRVSLLVFDSKPRTLMRLRVGDFAEPAPDLGLTCRRPGSAGMRHRDIEASMPTITRGVTGDATVRVCHDGRRIKLLYRCGLVEAKVSNAILRERLGKHPDEKKRYPKEFRYTGAGALDLQVHLAQDDPMASFEALLVEIRAAGGTPTVDPSLLGYLRRQARAEARRREPFARTIYAVDAAAAGVDRVVGIAKRHQVANPAVWGSPAVLKGARVEFERCGDRYRFEVRGEVFTISDSELRARFAVESEGETKGGWCQITRGLHKAFPALAAQWQARARAAGVDRLLTWDYQLDDAIELMMKPEGAICGWAPALGKSRLAVALILMSGCKHGLIVVESYLVGEMLKQIAKLDLDPTDWQVIDAPAKVEQLRRVNIISYARLRMCLRAKAGRKTYAAALRRRIGVLVADEGDLLANASSLQSRALWQVSARRVFPFSGTPIANLPKDALPLLAFAGGDGTSAQPYGYHRAYLSKVLRQSCVAAERGLSYFREQHVVTEWITNEFSETLRGARREIPAIANLPAYRAALAPHMKRRLVEEPDVARFVHVPEPTRTVHLLDWDDAHLSHYLAVAEEFRTWYQSAHRDVSNLVVLLARINAVRIAASLPSMAAAGTRGTFGPATSKQRWVAARIVERVRAGERCMVFANNPGAVDRLASMVERDGVAAVKLHGGRSISERTRDLDRLFREGQAGVLLATFGVAQKGLNVPEASHVILYDRLWLHTDEEQAIRRVLRPEQKRPVCVDYPMLRGGIDVYMSQLVAYKRDAEQSGVDWAEPTVERDSFMHIDTILGRFCEDLAALKGVDRMKLREALREAA
ncbi:MAG TPA: helicase-related protein [Burkholderiaceae bacterium]|nr:helicase-related protein [Burkholderiaceae bacterium]